MRLTLDAHGLYHVAFTTYAMIDISRCSCFHAMSIAHDYHGAAISRARRLFPACSRMAKKETTGRRGFPPRERRHIASWDKKRRRALPPFYLTSHYEIVTNYWRLLRWQLVAASMMRGALWPGCRVSDRRYRVWRRCAAKTFRDISLHYYDDIIYYCRAMMRAISMPMRLCHSQFIPSPRHGFMTAPVINAGHEYRMPHCRMAALSPHAAVNLMLISAPILCAMRACA